MSITGAESTVGDWPSSNFKMKFDPDFVNTDDTRGRYYWEITEDMLNATSNPGKLTALYNPSNGIWLQSGLYNKSSDGEGSTNRPWNRAAANSWFRIYDSATNSGVTSTSGLSYWAGIDDQVNNKKDSNDTPVLQWGKANTGDGANDTEKQTLGLGFINYNPTSYPAYSAPIRIYAYPGHGINVEATPVYANLYVSNGFDVGSTSKDTAVTVQPVKNGAVATGGDAFTITNVDTYTGSNEGTVTHYKPEKKNATVRITKTCTATEKVSAFFVYDLDNDNISAAFYSGKSYDTADHSYVNTDDYTSGLSNYYTEDGTPSGASSANYGWVHDGCPSSVTYGDSTNTSADPADIDFNYAVQWYVYDASGNYITTVLSSAFADMDTGKTQTYIARELMNKGYAVDGKAVAMCYDKPRYYYWDDDKVTGAMGWNSHMVNSGEGFAGYRFTGQWYTTVKTEPVTVDVKVR